jgi:hypothetical protein
MVRGSMPEMRSGTILGHEGIEARGGSVPNLECARILHAHANLVEKGRRESFELIEALTSRIPMTSPIGAYESLDRLKAGWLEVQLKPVA